jgi:hypothetical protein
MSRRKQAGRVWIGGGQTETRNPVPGHPSSEERTPDTRLRKRATNETTTNERRRTTTNDERRRTTNDDERRRRTSEGRTTTKQNECQRENKTGHRGFTENAPVVLDLPAALSSDVDRPTGPGRRLRKRNTPWSRERFMGEITQGWRPNAAESDPAALRRLVNRGTRCGER